MMYTIQILELIKTRKNLLLTSLAGNSRFTYQLKLEDFYVLDIFNIFYYYISLRILYIFFLSYIYIYIFETLTFR
jgi:hypothetical protein